MSATFRMKSTTFTDVFERLLYRCSDNGTRNGEVHVLPGCSDYVDYTNSLK